MVRITTAAAVSTVAFAMPPATRRANWRTLCTRGVGLVVVVVWLASKILKAARSASEIDRALASRSMRSCNVGSALELFDWSDAATDPPPRVSLTSLFIVADRSRSSFDENELAVTATTNMKTHTTVGIFALLIFQQQSSISHALPFYMHRIIEVFYELVV